MHKKEQSIVVFLSEGHEKHAPEFEFDFGKSSRYHESPDRIKTITEALNRLDFVEFAGQNEISNDFWNALNSIHNPEYIDFLKTPAPNFPSNSGYIYPDVFPKNIPPYKNNQAYQVVLGHFSLDQFAPIGPETSKAAFEAANTSFEAARSLVLNNYKNVYAVVRPPGHHAGKSSMAGYCYINNIAVAAAFLKNLGKIAVLDLDTHHGNGTQEIFWNESDVFFVSLHGDPGYEYPGYTGYSEEKGGENAIGKNLNFPLPAGCDGKTYLKTLDKALKQIELFSPSFLLISLGFDTYKNDPVGKFSLDLDDYEEMGRNISKLEIPKLFVQEGGYDLSALGEITLRFFSGINE
ncbi:MAG: histone deacetylase family protein [Anaerolineaceae bacterium]|nr:histone deacetylase family protein [Anaerolineaceae bacterium]